MSIKPLCALLLIALLVAGCDSNPGGPAAPSPSRDDVTQGFPKDAPVKGQAR